MAKANLLTAVFVKQCRTPGVYRDGQGLLLRVYPTGAKRWVLRVHESARRRRDVGLGSCERRLASRKPATAPPSSARPPARVAIPWPPSAPRARPCPPSRPPRGPCTSSVRRLLGATGKHVDQWINSLRDHAFPKHRRSAGLVTDRLGRTMSVRYCMPIWLAEARDGPARAAAHPRRVGVGQGRGTPRRAQSSRHRGLRIGASTMHDEAPRLGALLCVAQAPASSASFQQDLFLVEALVILGRHGVEPLARIEFWGSGDTLPACLAGCREKCRRPDDFREAREPGRRLDEGRMLHVRIYQRSKHLIIANGRLPRTQKEPCRDSRRILPAGTAGRGGEPGPRSTRTASECLVGLPGSRCRPYDEETYPSGSPISQGNQPRDAVKA